VFIGGLLWTRKWTFSFYKMMEIFWLAEELSIFFDSGSCIETNRFNSFIIYATDWFIHTYIHTFGGEVKPSVPCRRFAACKRSLHLRGSPNLGKITGQISRPHFHLSLLGSLASLRTYRHLASKVGTSKVGRKQWQTTPKNLPRMQCARAIPVTWLSSGSCQPGL
jgi:hypothetical protein